jgi:hypothetical protein
MPISKATPMTTYQLRWSPTAQVIGTVQAATPRLAIRKAPQPYRKFLGEIYAEEVPDAADSSTQP